MGRLLLIALAVLLLAAPAASAQSVVDDAAAALATDPVYVAPDADRALSSREADELRQRIQDSGAGPMYVAVLPQSALDEGGGSAEGVARELARRLQREGVYAVVAGTKFSAGGTNIRGAGDQATEALQAHKDEGVAAVLLDFTDRVGQLRAGESPGSGARDGGGGGGGAFSLLLLPLIAIGGGALLLSRRRRRKEEQAEVAELKENVRDDLVALGDDIRALDLDVEMPNANPQAKADYGRAVEAYDRADDLLDRARAPEDFEPIGAALEEGC